MTIPVLRLHLYYETQLLTPFSLLSQLFACSLPGIDVAFVMDSSAYHSYLDSPERIRPGTLQVGCIWCVGCTDKMCACVCVCLCVCACVRVHVCVFS
jgi:hypothetical protein